jgi:hypothetical protein
MLLESILAHHTLCKYCGSISYTWNHGSMVRKHFLHTPVLNQFPTCEVGISVMSSSSEARGHLFHCDAQIVLTNHRFCKDVPFQSSASTIGSTVAGTGPPPIRRCLWLSSRCMMPSVIVSSVVWQSCLLRLASYNSHRACQCAHRSPRSWPYRTALVAWYFTHVANKGVDC